MNNIDYQIEVMSIVGHTMAALQRTEGIFASCWMAFARRENIEGVEYFVLDDDIDVITNINQKKTLGRLFTDIKRYNHFNKTFEIRFNRFISNRNRLVHRIFNEKSYQSLNNKRALVRLHRFTSNLFRESIYFSEVFDTYLGFMYGFIYQKNGQKGEGVDLLRKINQKRRKNGMFNELFKYFNNI